MKVYRTFNDMHVPCAVRDMFRRRCHVAMRDTRLTHIEQVHLPKVWLAATQRQGWFYMELTVKQALKFS